MNIFPLYDPAKPIKAHEPRKKAKDDPFIPFNVKNAVSMPPGERATLKYNKTITMLDGSIGFLKKYSFHAFIVVENLFSERLLPVCCLDAFWDCGFELRTSSSLKNMRTYSTGVLHMAIRVV
jgi:hypothetical protein